MKNDSQWKDHFGDIWTYNYKLYHWEINLSSGTFFNTLDEVEYYRGPLTKVEPEITKWLDRFQNTWTYDGNIWTLKVDNEHVVNYGTLVKETDPELTVLRS